jgi:protein TonB
MRPTFRLPEPPRQRHLVAPSLLIHAAVVAAAVAATAAPAGHDLPRRPPGIPVYLPSAPMHPGPATAGGPPLVAAPTIDLPPQVDIPKLDPVPVAPGTPALDPKSFPGLPGLPGAAIPVPGGTVGATPYLVSEVDEPPELRIPGPVRYPAVLAAAGVEGQVALEFVVDTAGRVEVGSVVVVAAAEPRFIPAAVAAVEASRFRPARRQGEGVRVRVRQVVTFRL